MIRTTIIRSARTTVAALVAAAVLACGAGTAFAAYPSTLSAGTSIVATLSSGDINSKNANVGDRFSMTVVQPYPNGDAAYSGATVYGHVTGVQRASQGRKAGLQLGFDKIVLRNGMQAHVSGHVLNAGAKQESVIVKDAVGAGVGMIVGNYVGKHVGTNLGGLVGAAGGFLYANNLKAQIYIQRGAQVTMQLDHSVRPALRQAGQ
jgi:hypothetical protein